MEESKETDPTPVMESEQDSIKKRKITKKQREAQKQPNVSTALKAKKIKLNETTTSISSPPPSSVKPCEDMTSELAPPSAAVEHQDLNEATFGSLDDLPDNVVVCMRTFQAAQWRTLADALKDLVPECSVKFDKTGMKLISMDPGHIALVHLHALSEFYYCKEEITIGLNVMALYKMLRNLTTAGYMLEFTLTSDAPEYLQIVVTNTDKRTVTKNNLRLPRLPYESFFIPTTIFNRVLSLPSTDFQRHIRELSAVSKKIRIKTTRDVLALSATGSYGSSNIEIQPTASGMNWKKITEPEDQDSDATEGVFFSKYLERFARPLDDTVELFIRKNYPLVIR
jgi:proliferating cell nuclear antigen